MNRPQVRLPALFAVSVMVVSACSGEEETTGPATPEPTAVVAATTPETTIPATTAVPETAPPTTVVATTEPVPSTSATPVDTTLPDGVPPRVTFPDDPEKQAVVDAAYAYLEALRAASADPGNLDLRAALAETVAAPIAERVARFIENLAAAGELVELSPVQPTYTLIYESTVFAKDGSATFDACAVDGSLRIEVGGNGDGVDRVVDDTVVSASLTYQLDFADGRWLVSDLERFGVFEEQVGCG